MIEIAARNGPCRLSLGPPLPGPLLRRLLWPGERQNGWPSQADAGPKKRGRSGQRQILVTLGEIERQANVGIGYAFSAEHLMNDNLIHEALGSTNPGLG